MDKKLLGYKNVATAEERRIIKGATKSLVGVEKKSGRGEFEG